MRRVFPWLLAALAVIVAYFLFRSSKTGPVTQAQAKTKLQGTLDSITGITGAVSGLIGSVSKAFGSAPPPAGNVMAINAPAAFQTVIPPPATDYTGGYGNPDLSGVFDITANTGV